jgi:hypothetical protein
MARPTLADLMEATFAVIERAAVAGVRCPVTGSDGLTSRLTTALATDGKIKIEVYPHNFRRVTILVGPNAGKTTADPPNPSWKPYKTIEKGHVPTTYRRRADLVAYAGKVR